MSKYKYISSNGKSFDLDSDKMRAISGSFHDRKWKAVLNDAVYGSEVDSFSVDALSIKLTLQLRGSLSERKRILDDLTDAYEHDIANKTPGRLVDGDYYIDCYCMESDAAKSSLPYRTETEVTFLCPRPLWKKEQKFTFKKATSSANVHRYPATYPNTYASRRQSMDISADSNIPSTFKLIAYGPFASLSVQIGSNTYGVNYAAGAGEVMIIDPKASNKEEKVYLIKQNGEKVNLFKYRMSGTNKSVFKDIPSGKSAVNYSRNHDLELIVYAERSVPRWI